MKILNIIKIFNNLRIQKSNLDNIDNLRLQFTKKNKWSQFVNRVEDNCILECLKVWIIPNNTIKICLKNIIQTSKREKSS